MKKQNFDPNRFFRVSESSFIYHDKLGTMCPKKASFYYVSHMDFPDREPIVNLILNEVAKYDGLNAVDLKNFYHIWQSKVAYFPEPYVIRIQNTKNKSFDADGVCIHFDNYKTPHILDEHYDMTGRVVVDWVYTRRHNGDGKEIRKIFMDGLNYEIRYPTRWDENDNPAKDRPDEYWAMNIPVKDIPKLIYNIAKAYKKI